jgi:hypothetical protein
MQVLPRRFRIRRYSDRWDVRYCTQENQYHWYIDLGDESAEAMFSDLMAKIESDDYDLVPMDAIAIAQKMATANDEWVEQRKQRWRTMKSNIWSFLQTLVIVGGLILVIQCVHAKHISGDEFIRWGETLALFGGWRFLSGRKGSDSGD